jgi:AGZA family xanthine/uracil permease-like MFS transporter
MSTGQVAPARRETSVPAWWIRGDWNAFLGLFANIIANILVAASLLAFVVEIPADIVFGEIVPALALAVFVGNAYYAYMARRESIRRGRQVTALPYGPSVGHLFFVTFLIIFPIAQATGDPRLAWQVGVAWCVVESVTEIVASFVGPWVRRNTPRAAMLAVMAGIAITLIGMSAAFRIWEVPYIGLVCLGFVLVAWIADTRLPGNLPAAVALVVVGTAIAWIGTWLDWIPDGNPGRMDTGEVSDAVSGITLTFPGLNISWDGFVELVPYLATAIPFGLGGFLNTMDNVESAAAAGDDYSTREAMIADGGGSVLGALFGSPFATGVYVGHPGWKTMGAGMGYSAATGIAVLLVAVLGVVSLFLAVIPLVAVVPILLYIAMIMGAQAFQATPLRHAPAVVIALVPWLASFAKQLVDGALQAAGTSAEEVGYAALAEQNVLYQGLETLEHGALFTSTILGAMTAFLIDHRYRPAALMALTGAAFSFFGLMHAPEVEFGAAEGAALAYLLLAVLIFALGLAKTPVGEEREVAWTGPPGAVGGVGASGYEPTRSGR